jgi:hypothetical protein
MAPKCSICQHKARHEIDKALAVDNASIRGIARQFRVSDDALSRHVKNGHLIAKIKQAVKAQEVADSDDLLKEINETEDLTKTIIKAAMNRKKKTTDNKDAKDPDYRTALDGIARREKQIELKGKILGSFKGEKPSGDGKPLTVKILRAGSMDDL